MACGWACTAASGLLAARVCLRLRSAAKHRPKELANGVALLVRLGGRRLPGLLLLLLRGRWWRLLGIVGRSVPLLLLVLGLRCIRLLLAVGRRRRPAAAVLLLHGRAVGLLRRA